MTVTGQARREGAAKLSAFYELAKRLPEFRALLGNIEVDAVLKRYPKAVYSKNSEHASFALEALTSKLKSPPQPPGGESAQVIFNEVPEREIAPVKGWYEDIQVDDDILKDGKWHTIIRKDTDNTGEFLVWADPSVKFPSMGRNAGEGRIRPHQVRVARRNDIEFSGSVPYVAIPPQSVEPPAFRSATLTPAQAQALHNTAQVTRYKLGADRTNRRLGRDEKPERKDTRTGEQIMEETALAQTAVAIQQAQTVGVQTRDDMERAVQIAYSMNGNSALSPDVIKALAFACWELGLSPNPAMGHMYCFPNKNKRSGENSHIITIGKDGLINLARRDHEFILRETRLMTEAERALHCEHAEDVGVMVGLINMAEARQQVELMRIAGLTFKTPNELFDMVAKWYPGRWRKKAYSFFDNDKKKWVDVEDSIPNTWSKFQVAEKRALRTALKALGLNSNVGRLPDLRAAGFDYDMEEGGWVQVTPPPTLTPTASPAVTPDAALADIEAAFSAQVEAEQQPIEGSFEETPETTQAAAQPESSETQAVPPVEEIPPAAPAKVERPYSAQQLITRLQELAEISKAPTVDTPTHDKNCRNLTIDMQNKMEDTTRRWILEQAFGVKSSKLLTDQQIDVISKWFYKTDTDTLLEEIAAAKLAAHPADTPAQPDSDAAFTAIESAHTS